MHREKIVKGIILHCSAAPPTFGWRDINAWHRARGFLKIGYHYVVDTEGAVHPCRQDYEKGAHTKGYNDRIGICLLGRGTGDYTKIQLKNCGKLIKNLMFAYSLVPSEVFGHHNVNENKTCPNLDVEDFKRKYI